MRRAGSEGFRAAAAAAAAAVAVAVAAAAVAAAVAAAAAHPIQRHAGTITAATRIVSVTIRVKTRFRMQTTIPYARTGGLAPPTPYAAEAPTARTVGLRSNVSSAALTHPVAGTNTRLAERAQGCPV